MIAAGLAAAIATAARASGSRLLFGTKRLPIGINLYMLGGDVRRDLLGTLKSLADIGYGEIETSLDIHPAKTIREALDRAGLRCSNLGLLPKPLRGGKSLENDSAELAADAHMLGASYATCTLFPLPDGMEMRPQRGEDSAAMLARISAALSADHWKRTADYLNAKGAEFRRHGIRFAYHNHNAELVPHGETNGLAILLERTDPGLVSFHMDAGWIVAAGWDPAVLLRAYPGRFRLMHVKDVAPAHVTNVAMKVTTTEVGSGIVDWPRVLAAAVRSGVRHFAVEQEPPYANPPIESARKSFAYLSALRIEEKP